MNKFKHFLIMGVSLIVFVTNFLSEKEMSDCSTETGQIKSGDFFSSFCGAGGNPPNALQPTEAYCAELRFSSPIHLQRRSISNGVRCLFQRKEEL
jgi:hypothetical protein